MAHASLDVEVAVVLVLQAALKRAGVQAEAFGHVFDAQFEQAWISANPLLQLKRHTLATCFLVQSLLGKALGLLVQDRKSAFEWQIEHATLDEHGVGWPAKMNGHTKEGLEMVAIAGPLTRYLHRDESFF